MQQPSASASEGAARGQPRKRAASDGTGEADGAAAGGSGATAKRGRTLVTDGSDDEAAGGSGTSARGAARGAAAKVTD
jgi:hypothetical protein